MAHWPLSWVAYGLATAWGEARLEPIREIGKGAGKRYGKAQKYPPNIPYGRGFVQLTWDFNYEWADKNLSDAGLIAKGDLLRDFDLALKPELAAFILVRGMETGAFTGKSIADFLPSDDRPATKEQYKKARQVINGSDKDDYFADVALKTFAALHRAGFK